ncbi:glycosyltransferase family 4 protein [Caproicibacterium sp. NSD3]
MISLPNATILKLKIGNITQNNMIQKGCSTLKIGNEFIGGIKRFFKNVKFDLVIYSTPPITFCNTIEYIKRRDDAKTYLLLKDIFPQNSVDIGILSKSGLKGLIYKYFRNKEKKLYRISDYIGCMSPANVEYVIKNNKELDPKIVEVCPNSVEVVDMSVDNKTRNNIRSKYGIPKGKKVFIYGGNLGAPQGIDFLIQCLVSQENNKEVFFLIVGDGTEYDKLYNYVNNNRPLNVKLMKRLPKEDYDIMVGACDIGLIFLNHRFTIPNFPSRLLSYMQAKIPVLAVTDLNTDIGEIIVNGGYGWWCESNDITSFDKLIKLIINTELSSMKEIEYNFLLKMYNVELSYKIIMEHFL